MNQVLFPVSREDWLKKRARNINSSEISALYGVCPYINGRPERWAKFLREKQTGISEPIIQTDGMEFGLEMEDAVARMAAKRYGWTVRHMGEYIQDPVRRQGSSFDRHILTPEDSIGEIKVVGGEGFHWNQGWSTRNKEIVRFPNHIRFQIQFQLKLSGKPFAYLVAFRVADMKMFRSGKIMADVALHQDMDQKTGLFWKALENNIVVLDPSRMPSMLTYGHQQTA